MMLAVIRVRGTVKVKPDIKETLRLLRLNRVNHCVVVPDTPEYRGMLQKAKDYITWGELNPKILETLIRERGRMEGGKPLTDDLIKSSTSFKNVEELAESVGKGDTVYGKVQGLNPIFRLAPPRKGGYKSIKRSFATGGTLGNRREAINDLLQRMI